MQRLFVAINLPEETERRLLALRTGIERAKWIKPGQIHLTLRFIGDSFGDRTELLKMALTEITRPAFEISLRGVATFPPPGRRGRPKVLMVQIADSPQLLDCQAEVEKAARVAGFSTETRDYRPHITLARFPRPASADLQRWLKKQTDFEDGPIAVTQIHLIASELTQQGAIHTTIESYPLS